MKLKFIVCFLLSVNGVFSQTDNAESKIQNSKSTEKKIILEEGTLIKAALKNEIRGGSMKVGDQVEFTLAQPIVIGDQVVVAPGSKILGSVSEARSSGVLGRKGKLAFNIEYLYLNSGQVIKLTGQSAKNLKGSGAIVAATAIVLTPLGLLIPGKGAKFEKGAMFEAYIAKDTELRQ
ncbi:MAG: hypothetical protein WCP74_10100 [Sphingobacteriia bacterium]|jgi:hypothetical protein